MSSYLPRRLNSSMKWGLQYSTPLIWAKFSSVSWPLQELQTKGSGGTEPISFSTTTFTKK